MSPQINEVAATEYPSISTQLESVDSAGFGAVLRGIDLKRMTDTELKHAEKMLYEHRLVVFKNQKLSPEQYIAFANKLGKPEPYLQDNYHHPDHPVIFVSSNVERNGKKMGVARTGGYWHSDTSFQQKPMPLTMLYPQIIPKDWQRSTLYIDMAEVYKALPAQLKQQLEHVSFIHSGKWRYKVREEDAGIDLTEILEMIDAYSPPASHPAVLVHPVTGEKTIYGSRGFTVGINEMHPADSDKILQNLFDFAESERFVRKVFWEIGDVIVWDNRFLLHRSGRAESLTGNARDTAKAEEKTMMFRITLDDEKPLSL